MLCPKCNRENPDGTAICRFCDNILDASFLGEGFTGEENIRPKAAPHQSAKPAPAAVKEDLLETDDAVSRERDRLRQSRQVVKAEDRPKALRLDDQPEQSYQEAAGTLFTDAVAKAKLLWKNFLGLEKADRLSLGGAVASIICAFLPWMRIISAGSITLMGLEMDGFLVVLLAAAGGTAVVLRQKESWQEKAAFLVWGQAGVSALSLLFILIQMVRLDSYARADLGVPVAVRLEAGMVLALAAAAVMAAGSWLTLKPLLKKK